MRGRVRAGSLLPGALAGRGRVVQQICFEVEWGGGERPHAQRILHVLAHEFTLVDGRGEGVAVMGAGVEIECRRLRVVPDADRLLSELRVRSPRGLALAAVEAWVDFLHDGEMVEVHGSLLRRAA
jgi:hypothetical protein